jgi:hypothetical protein
MAVDLGEKLRKGLKENPLRLYIDVSWEVCETTNELKKNGTTNGFCLIKLKNGAGITIANGST